MSHIKIKAKTYAIETYTESSFFLVPQFIVTTVYWGVGFSKIGLDFPGKHLV